MGLFVGLFLNAGDNISNCHHPEVQNTHIQAGPLNGCFSFCQMQRLCLFPSRDTSFLNELQLICEVQMTLVWKCLRSLVSLLSRYGLILSQKKGLSKSLQKHSVFEDDSDDEVGKALDLLEAEEEKCKYMSPGISQHFAYFVFVPQTTVGESLQKEAIKKKTMKQVRGRMKRLHVMSVHVVL